MFTDCTSASNDKCTQLLLGCSTVPCSAVQLIRRFPVGSSTLSTAMS